MKFPKLVAGVALASIACFTFSLRQTFGQTAAPAPARKPAEEPLFVRMNYGQVLSYTLGHATKGKSAEVLALKGINIKLGTNAMVCFDTDLMRYAAGWTGGLNIKKSNLSGRGSNPALIDGSVRFQTKIGPGWVKGNVFTDPRTGVKNGPLPKEWAHYRGFYLHGNETVLAYTVGGSEVLETPGFDAQTETFSRSFSIKSSATSMTLLVCEVEGAAAQKLEGENVAVVSAETATAVGIVAAPVGAKLETIGGRIQLKLPALKSSATFKVVIWSGASAELAKFGDAVKQSSKVVNAAELCRGGQAHWTAPIVTKGTRSNDSGPYVVDTLTLPDKNPWDSWMKPAAMDFFSDGRAAISTLNGDVWIVSGIDDQLQNLTWKRFATGLFEPLGLRILNDQVYVLGRDQITRLHDLNSDGEADFYENFNNDGAVSPSYHAFKFDLQTDRAGNFYYAVCGNLVAHDVPLHSCMIKVSTDGSTLEKYATGLRAPNGMAIGPNDEIVCGDNQGHWTPSSRINLVKRGGFYGYNGDPRTVDKKAKEVVHETYDAPLCWIPMTADNSCGGEVWATSNRWGPFDGKLLHTSYGKCDLFVVLMETIGDQAQGGVVKLPLKFASGIMRARFNPFDGQLYVCGLKGWQTSAVKDGALQRVRYTSKPVHMPIGLEVKHNGIQITFTNPLDATEAADAQNYSVQQWNYIWAAKYGSDEMSVLDPTKKAHDEVPIKSVRVSADHKSVFLEIADLKPVMQMAIKVNLKAADGTPISTEIDNTINKVGP